MCVCVLCRLECVLRGAGGSALLRSTSLRRLALLLLLPQEVWYSVDYVIITSLSFAGCPRRRIARTKRRVRYAILDHKDNEEAMEMLPKGEYTSLT